MGTLFKERNLHKQQANFNQTKSSQELSTAPEKFQIYINLEVSSRSADCRINFYEVMAHEDRVGPQ
jgi:hypothetical protein